MNKKHLKKEWKLVLEEIHTKPKCRTPYPKQVVSMRELLLCMEVHLGNIGNNENILFNSTNYKLIKDEYFRQKLLLRV